MRILIVSQYFWPESFIINDIVRSLHKLGHTLVIATGKPNYPDGKVFSGYTVEGVQQEIFDEGIEVYRVPLRPRGKATPREIIRNYLSFIYSGLRWFPSLLANKQFDIILVFAPSPITMAIPAILLKWRKKTHLAVWVQDLWPESLSATGYVRNRHILGLTGLLVRAIYAFTDTLLVQSRAFIDPVARYASRDKILYYSNSSVDLLEKPDSAAVPQELQDLLAAHFCVVFAGNFGTAQSLETLVDACERLRNLPDFRLVMVGSGNMLTWLEQQKASRNLDNLVIAGRYPAAAMPSIFKHAAGLLVSLKKKPIFSYTIPSKVQSYLSAGRPVIAALDGEGARVIKEAGAGFTSGAEDVDGLVRNIEQLYHMSDSEREALGKSGRCYFLEHFEMKQQTRRLVTILEQRLSGQGLSRT